MISASNEGPGTPPVAHYADHVDAHFTGTNLNGMAVSHYQYVQSTPSYRLVSAQGGDENEHQEQENSCNYTSGRAASGQTPSAHPGMDS
jgi:hypothetical protein